MVEPDKALEEKAPAQDELALVQDNSLIEDGAEPPSKALDKVALQVPNPGALLAGAAAAAAAVKLPEPPKTPDAAEKPSPIAVATPHQVPRGGEAKASSVSTPMLTATELDQPSPLMPKASSLEASPSDPLPDPLARTLDQPSSVGQRQPVPSEPMSKEAAQETKRSFWEKLRQFLRL